MVLKVINQLFNYLAAPGKEAGFRHKQTTPSKGALPLRRTPSHGRRDMAPTEPWCPPHSPASAPDDHPLPKRAGAENNE